MRPNPLETTGLVTFTEGILNGKLHFLYSAGVLVVLLSWNLRLQNYELRLKTLINQNLLLIIY